MKIFLNFSWSIIIIFTVSIATISYGQKNLLPGYIITLNGDTTQGEIDYRNWGKNPKIIRFKAERDNKFSSYSPIDIAAFSVKDEKYVGAIVETELSPRNTNNLLFEKDLKIKIDTTFLQAIIEGPKSLYFDKNSIENDGFYIMKNNELELLVYKIFKRRQYNEVGGYKVVKAEYRKYTNQLKNYFNNCSSLKAQLSKTTYDNKSIEKLFLSYYECVDGEMDFYKKREKASCEIGLLGGVTVTSLEFQSDEFDYLSKADLTNSSDFSAGVFLDIVLPRNQRKWSINNELIYTSYSVEGNYTEYLRENRYTVTSIELRYSYLKLNNMIRFRCPIGNTFFHLNAGISNGVALSETNNKREILTSGTFERISESKALNDTRKFEQGLIFGLGIKFNKYSFETRFERGNGMSDYLALRSISNRYFLFIGYKF